MRLRTVPSVTAAAVLTGSLLTSTAACTAPVACAGPCTGPPYALQVMFRPGTTTQEATATLHKCATGSGIERIGRLTTVQPSPSTKPYLITSIYIHTEAVSQHGRTAHLSGRHPPSKVLHSPDRPRGAPPVPQAGNRRSPRRSGQAPGSVAEMGAVHGHHVPPLAAEAECRGQAAPVRSGRGRGTRSRSVSGEGIAMKVTTLTVIAAAAAFTVTGCGSSHAKPHTQALAPVSAKASHSPAPATRRHA